MNSKERCLAAVEGRPVDRVPVFPLLMSFAAGCLGVSYREFASNGHVLAEAQLKARELFGVDAITACSDAFRVSADLGGDMVFPESTPPFLARPLVRSEADLQRLTPPDVARRGSRIADRALATREMVRAGGAECLVLGWVDMPFAEACSLCGVAEFLTLMHDQPRLAHRLLEFLTGVVVDFGRVQLEAGAPMIGAGDAAASLVSPAMYRAFALPYEQRVCAALHAAGGLVKLHICGNTRHLLPDMVTSGADLFNVDHLVDFSLACESYGAAEKCFKGNLNPVADMLQATPEQCQRLALACLRQAVGRRFMLSPGCEVPPGVSVEVFGAFCQAPLADCDTGGLGAGSNLERGGDVRRSGFLSETTRGSRTIQRRATMDFKTSDYDKSNVNRLLTALNHQEPDRLPHIELWVTSQAVYEHVLERKLPYVIGDAAEGGQSITPEDDVEFAQRLGQDAVLCNFNWRPNNVFEKAADGTRHYVNGSIKTAADLDDLEPPTPIDDQLRHLERYFKAAQGTGVGIIPNLTSFFDSAMLAIGVTDSLYMFYDNRPLVEKLMDILLDHQEKVMQAVCDHFGREIALAMVNDDIGYNTGLLIRRSMFLEIFPHRMRRLIAPAKAYGKQVLMHTDGKMETILPILYEVGITANHPVEPESNDLAEVKKKWAGKMSLFGNVHTPLLAYGRPEEIEAKVREYCLTVAPGGGYVLGSSTSIMDGIPPENFVTMVEAVHKFGCYGSLGEPYH